jgi:hypothetical protein
VVSLNAAVAAGGSGTAECTKVTSVNVAQYQVRPGTLEDLVALNQGHPCVFTPNAATGPRNEWWTNSTVSIGTLGGDAPAYPAYNANRSLRIGFGSGNAVTFYNCPVMASNGTARNCDPIGTGTYRIDTVGDARVMRFAGVPADAAPLTYHRQFVERGGVVYYGYRTKLRHSFQIRPNLEATDALFAPLGIVR